jgi:regulator of protease activity HflC (stomatin/prohibitin superfamily)
MKSRAGDPLYIHIILYVVIAILIVILIKVAIIDPKEIVAVEKFNRIESRLRMDNIKEAQILWEKKHGTFTDNLDSLILFVKQDSFVDSVVNAFDSLTMKSANPFKPLSHGEFSADSLIYSPRSHSMYTIQIDTSVSIDTTVNRRGTVIRVDTSITLGSKYFLEDPDGYGTIGDLYNDALKNTSSWE